MYSGPIGDINRNSLQIETESVFRLTRATLKSAATRPNNSVIVADSDLIAFLIENMSSEPNLGPIQVCLDLESSIEEKESHSDGRIRPKSFQFRHINLIQSKCK